MRACMVTYSFYESDNRVRRYAETLVKLGYRVDAIALRGNGQTGDDVLINGVRVLRIQRRVRNEKSRLSYLKKLVMFFLRSMIILAREQIKERYDLIHVHSVPDFEVFAAWYPKLTGSKVILDIHDIVPEFYVSKFDIDPRSLSFKMLVAVERWSAAFSDHVIAANHIWHRRLQQRSIRGSKVTTILNFPDTRLFQRHGRERKDHKFVALYPGSLNYHQGLDLAIHAFSLLRDSAPEAEFHIYGSGDQFEFLNSLVARLELQDRVFFKGSLPLEQMVSVIENSDLGIVPKRRTTFGNEAFSTKILEFMTMGIPVIVPDTEIDRYYFNDTVARFFRAGDPRSLADAILGLIRNSVLRESLARNASEFVKQYRWDSNQSIYTGLIDSLLKPREDGSLRVGKVAKEGGRCL